MTTLELTIKEKPVVSNEFYTKEYVIKYKRKIKAKIHLRTTGKFRLYIGGLCWDKDSLEACNDHVIDTYTNFVETLSREMVKIRIITK